MTDTIFPDIDKNRIIDFCVHNVGQALATSFAYENEVPFLYFDYGLPDNRNKRTLPADVELKVNSQTKIYLSHIHMDHWLGLNKFTEAIPDKDDNCIIYNYGDGNTHGHPSKVSDYISRGWSNEFHTAQKGDFVKKIRL